MDSIAGRLAFDLVRIGRETEHIEGGRPDGIGGPAEFDRFVAQQGDFLPEDFRCGEVGIPPVGVFRGDLTDGAVAIATDHDRWSRIRSRKRNRVGDPVILPFDCHALAGPERGDDLQRFFELLEADARPGKVVVVGEIFVFFPASADPKDQLATGKNLQRGRHIRQLAGIAIALAEDDRPDGQIGIARRGVHHLGPAFEIGHLALLQVIDEPESPAIAVGRLQNALVRLHHLSHGSRSGNRRDHDPEIHVCPFLAHPGSNPGLFLQNLFEVPHLIRRSDHSPPSSRHFPAVISTLLPVIPTLPLCHPDLSPPSSRPFSSVISTLLLRHPDRSGGTSRRTNHDHDSCTTVSRSVLRDFVGTREIPRLRSE